MLLFTQRRLLQYDKLSKGKSRDAINKILSIHVKGRSIKVCCRHLRGTTHQAADFNR